jgi:hypothetical protein
MFPVPWPQRARGSTYVKAAIHISFRTDADFHRIWKEASIAPQNFKTLKDTYKIYPPDHQLMLGEWCIPDDVRTAMQTAVTVLGELLSGFNEIIFRSYIEPDPGFAKRSPTNPSDSA